MYVLEFVNDDSDISEVGECVSVERLELAFNVVRRWGKESGAGNPRVCVYVQAGEPRPVTTDDCPDFTMSRMPGGYVQVADYRNEIAAVPLPVKELSA